MRPTLLFVTFVLMALASCTHDAQAPLSNDVCVTPLSYEQDILPIIEASCNMAGCHAGAYSTYEGITPKLGSGLLIDRVFNRKGDPVLGMPPAPQTYPLASFQMLSETDLEKIRCWTRQGYPR